MSTPASRKVVSDRMLVTGPRLASAASLHYNRPMHLHRGNLFLVGMPGCGKSTLGRLLAKRLNKPFYDADVELERRLGVSIPLIFELEGEPGFRDREQAVLADLVAETNIVLSTGGGAILRPANRELLTQNGTWTRSPNYAVGLAPCLTADSARSFIIGTYGTGHECAR